MEIGFMFATPYAWLHQHVIGHHSFPNIQGKDPDLYHSPRYVRHSSDIRHRYPHFYQTVAFIWTWLVGVPVKLLFGAAWESLTKPSYNRVVTFAQNKHLNTDSIKPRLLEYIFIVHIIPFLLHGLTLKGFLFSILPIYFFSVCFMISS